MLTESTVQMEMTASSPAFQLQHDYLATIRSCKGGPKLYTCQDNSEYLLKLIVRMEKDNERLSCEQFFQDHTGTDRRVHTCLSMKDIRFRTGSQVQISDENIIDSKFTREETDQHLKRRQHHSSRRTSPPVLARLMQQPCAECSVSVVLLHPSRHSASASVLESTQMLCQTAFQQFVTIHRIGRNEHVHA